MKILHYSDKSSPEFSKLYLECDVLVTTGDLTSFDFPGLETIENKKPAFGVYGNHDAGEYLEKFGITNLHLQVVNFNGLSWGGFQGCPRYKSGEFQYSEEEAQYFAKSFPYVDVLLLHAGGKDLLDEDTDPVHQGSIHVAKYILEKKPKYVFVGHQYTNAEMVVKETRLFRTYGARLIEI